VSFASFVEGSYNHYTKQVLIDDIFRTKNNPVLIGEPGVGKTAIAEGLAQRIVNRDVPASLIARLYSLDMGALMAGAKFKGEYEERIKAVLSEVEKAAEDGGPGVILFIDELHLIMAGRGAEGGGMDAGNLFKPLLARGKLRCIGATTLSEYRKYIETDPALERRFAQVIVNEPSVAETISILRGIREKYEVHHGVRIMDGALIAAATLAHRYLTSRRLPDSAIDLVDEACARYVQLSNRLSINSKFSCSVSGLHEKRNQKLLTSSNAEN
jgi:ATP-dependent Clp protease ATP-binding subunit ClpB